MSTVDVWFVRVASGAAADPVLSADLSAAERDEVARLGMLDDRDRAATARASARGELARRLGVHPRRVPLATSAEGKPFIEGSCMGVSWSHSGRWVALAISTSGPVGVDIEKTPTEVPTRALALLGLASMEQFVTREALGKAAGRGLGGPWPEGFVVRILAAPAGYLAAVAAAAAPVAITCREDADRELIAVRTRLRATTTIAPWGFPGSSYAANWPLTDRRGTATFKPFPKAFER